MAATDLELEVEHPEVKNSMIRALANVGSRHLLDKRLHPLPELREAALAGGAAYNRTDDRVAEAIDRLGG